MARTDVATTRLVPEVDILAPAGVAVDQPNGMRVIAATGLGAQGAKIKRFMIRITNTSASTRVVTVVRGPNAQDPAATDYATQAIPVTTGEINFVVGPKYVQADGGVYLNFVTGHTGVVIAYELPGGAG
jgi:hypothetical protein